MISSNHEYNWYKYDNTDHLPLNRRLWENIWGIQFTTVDTILEISDVACEYLLMDYFLLYFSLDQHTDNVLILEWSVVRKNKQGKEYMRIVQAI